MQFAQNHYMNICSYDQVGVGWWGSFGTFYFRHFAQNIDEKIFIIVQNDETRPLTPASGTPKKQGSPLAFLYSFPMVATRGLLIALATPTNSAIVNTCEP